MTNSLDCERGEQAQQEPYPVSVVTTRTMCPSLPLSVAHALRCDFENPISHSIGPATARWRSEAKPSQQRGADM